MTFKLKWRGKAVTDKLTRCSIQGINATMTEAVIEAKGNHPWQNRTGTLERSISITVPARRTFNAVVGQWGTKGVRYGLFLELKKQFMWLRPAADRTYPNLARNIERCMRIG